MWLGRYSERGRMRRRNRRCVEVVSQNAKVAAGNFRLRDTPPLLQLLARHADQHSTIHAPSTYRVFLRIGRVGGPLRSNPRPPSASLRRSRSPTQKLKRWDEPKGSATHHNNAAAGGDIRETGGTVMHCILWTLLEASGSAHHVKK